jgi:hypothetical protein
MENVAQRPMKGEINALTNCSLPNEHSLDKAAHREESLIRAALNPGTAS